MFVIPFGLRVLIHKESGSWTSLVQAFYHAHLELFLGNGCLGVGVLMLLALTVERYTSVCHPGRTRTLMSPPQMTVVLIPLLTFLLYLPSVFRSQLTQCVLPDGGRIYRKHDNYRFLNSVFYSIYKIVVEIVYKVGPTVLLAGFNLRIMIVYRNSCDRRRRMTLCRTTSSDEDPRKFAEERRLILLLGSTSILFLVCISPMVILNITLSESNLSIYSYQVFRAIANLLEVTNYSITFYIYCLFSEDFRNTLLRTFRWPWGSFKNNRGNSQNHGFGAQNKHIGVKVSTVNNTTSTNNTLSVSQPCIQRPASGSTRQFLIQAFKCISCKRPCSNKEAENV